MACNCVDNLEQNTLDHLKGQYKERSYEDVSGWSETGLQNVAFGLGEGGCRKPYFLYKSRYTFTKTNGQTSALKTENVNIYPTYCPFCGLKYH